MIAGRSRVSFKLAIRRPLIAKVGFLGVGLIAIVVLLVPPKAAPGALVWNFTPSVPLGLYRIDGATWALGDRVAVRPTSQLADALLRARVLEPGRLLLKRVSAAAGDTVCRDGANVSVNGAVVARAKEADRQGSKLPTWSGCVRLGVRQVLLLGEMSESFDGRYFGPTDAADIIGRISPLILLPGYEPDIPRA
jgi:conjugative transfer signal peptidase TraF